LFAFNNSSISGNKAQTIIIDAAEDFYWAKNIKSFKIVK